MCVYLILNSFLYSPAKKTLKKNKIFKQHVMREYILKCSGLEMWTAES